MDLNLIGKRAYLTAASDGLGNTGATELLREGVDVTISSHNEVNLQTATDSIAEATG